MGPDIAAACGQLRTEVEEAASGPTAPNEERPERAH
jgi:hypothetical protein